MASSIDVRTVTGTPALGRTAVDRTGSTAVVAEAGRPAAAPVPREYWRLAAFVTQALLRRDARALQVVSSGAGEGTTETVQGLARALDEAFGLRVLVVRFGTARREAGRGTALPADPRTTPEASLPVLADAGIRWLPEAVEVTGRVTTVRADWSAPLDATRLRAVLEETRGHFDLCVVDSVAVLEAPTALAVASAVPATLLVVEGSRTRLAAAQRARLELERAGATLIGCVLARPRHPIPRWLYRWLVG